MPQPILGSQILDDTFEKLTDQAGDVAKGLKDLVAGDTSADAKGDAGIEQLAGQQDPKQAAQQAQKQGIDPKKIAERREKDKREIEFFREQVGGWDEHYKRMMQEEEMKKKQAAEAEQQQKQQEIIQLQEEEARAATLNPQKASAKKGPGSAFVTQSTKSQTEFSKQATQ